MTRGKRLGEWVERNFRFKAEAARAFGVTDSQLGLYIANKKKPGADVLERRALAGLDVSWYLADKPGAGLAPGDSSMSPSLP